MADKSKIGMEFPPFIYEVGRGKIREFTLAIEEDNPLFVNSEAARSAGYKDTPVPPTFLTVPFMWNSIVPKALEELKVDYLKSALHAEEEYEYFEEIYPGDILEGKSKIKNITEKVSKRGMINIIEIETIYTNQHDHKVAAARNVIIEQIKESL